MRVLLVEDSENDAMLLLRELRRAGYEVDHERVYTAEEMGAALRSGWDVIVSDYRMPSFSAMEALEMAAASGSDTPFIVVSGRIGEDVAVEAIRAGAYDYVMKGNLSRLPQTVGRGLEKAEEQRQRRRVEEELRRRDAILEAVRFAAEQFLGEATGWEESIRAVLRRLGEATEASRVYVFENYKGEDGELWATMRYEWSAPGISTQIDNPVLMGIPYKAAGFGRWMRALGGGDLVHGHVREFPESEQPELRAEEILSIALVPIFVEGRWWGFIGFDECVVEREWSAAEVGALGAAAGTLGAALRRRQTEERLRGSEERYRAVIEQATDGIYLLDAETRRFVETNPSFQRMFGYTAEEIREMEIYDLVAHPREDVDATIARTLRSGRRILGERKYRRKDGALLDVEVGVSVISLEGRDVICTIVRDTTERKKNEEALRQSEKLYRTVIEQATENIFLIDVETRRIVESNRAFREALGYSQEEIHGMTLYELVAADGESVDANVRRILEQINPSVGERRYVRKDGSLLHVEVSAGVIVRDGRQTLVGVAHDITERAQAQRMLEERVATLSGIASEFTLDQPTENLMGDLARSVVNASTAVACGIVLIGEGGGMVDLFGSYGLPEGYTAGLAEAYRAGASSPNLEAFRSLRPVLRHDLRTYILADPLYAPVHRFMREVPWDVAYSLPLVSKGRALGAMFFCFLPDGEPGEDEKVFLRAVADQSAVAVENARLFSEARGKAALEERQRLARELHDSVSQALYGIALGVETARELLPDDPESAAEPLDYATTLAEAGMTEMRALIFELRPESLEKEGLVAALEKQAAAVQARHGLRVEAELDREPEASLEVKEALYRVVQEALHNTVKHARATNVKLKLEESPEGFTLGISDDGVGFDARNDFPGHLGLKSMRERATRLGGTLEVTSEPGYGVRILARVPR